MNILPWHQAEFERLLADKARLPHANLLHGRQGIGKAAFARTFAQTLLCESPVPSGAACGQCAACHWFEAGTHPDFRQIEPESLAETPTEEQGSDKKASQQITIEQIRVLPDFIGISSHRGGPKVILIHPAEALNISAANALLKSLEEPPAHTYFLLVSHRPHSLLPTIKSRCQQLVLQGPAPAAAAAWLKSQGMANPELALAQTGNSPLIALQLDNEEYWRQRNTLLKGIASADFDALALAEQVRDYPIPQVVSWLQKWSYDLISQKFLGTIRYNPDHNAALAAAAAQVDALPALRFHRELVQLQRIVNHPLNPRLFIEQMLISYAGLLVQPQRAAA
ncbi:MAG: DNA polymerase III subunit delta' [Burkholderiales bacterium]|nr:DNA polymerase III subunit delta' [Burkholderiales bacterium]